MSDPPNELKQCARCKEWFTSAFFNRVKKTGKLTSYCRACNNKNSREHYIKNHDHIKEYRKSKQDEATLSSIKKRAKQKGLEFNLDIEDIKGTTCPVFGIELQRGSKQGPSDSAPSVDRIDNSKGYVKGNVQVLSNLANKMKTNATPEQLLQFAEWVFKTYKNSKELLWQAILNQWRLAVSCFGLSGWLSSTQHSTRTTINTNAPSVTSAMTMQLSSQDWASK